MQIVLDEVCYIMGNRGVILLIKNVCDLAWILNFP